LSQTRETAKIKACKDFMFKIKCPNCESKVWYMATTCPKCGFRMDGSRNLDSFLNLDQIIKFLIQIKQESLNRKKNVFSFSSDLWQKIEPPLSEDVEDVLLDLVIDFAYYVDDEKLRRQDGSYYGPERLGELIQSALDKLEALGVSIPKNE
jgi:hypothetical protein